MNRRTVWVFCVSCVGLGIAGVMLVSWPGSKPGREVIDVHPGQDIQEALEAGAARKVKPIIRIHSGVYRPSVPGEALLFFNSRHDGIVLEGSGEVILTAANPDVADPRASSYPAIVNHVVYFGDGVFSETILRNVTITGARGFVKGPPDLVPLKTFEDLTRSASYLAHESSIESNEALPKSHYFYTDGGAILVYGRSYPTIENVEVSGNSSSVCGGGVSVQHLVPFGGAVQFKNCVFRDNHAAVSGSAVDLLTPGSYAILDNCLFTKNISDEKIVSPRNSRYGALSVFPGCKAIVTNCTFTDNWSGVDDRGDSIYERTIFWKNHLPGGINPNSPFEVNITNPDGVAGCYFSDSKGDLNSNVSRTNNTFDAPNPAFDGAFRPHHPLYEGVGYRP